MNEEISTKAKKVNDTRIELSNPHLVYESGMREGDIVKVHFSANASATSGTYNYQNASVKLKKPLTTLFPAGLPAETVDVKVSLLRKKPKSTWDEIRQYLGE